MSLLFGQGNSAGFTTNGSIARPPQGNAKGRLSRRSRPLIPGSVAEYPAHDPECHKAPTMGGIIARVAEAWGYACWTLQHTDDEDQRHHAWCHLAEMRNGYQDAITQISGGLITLASPWPPLLGLFVGR